MLSAWRRNFYVATDKTQIKHGWEKQAVLDGVCVTVTGCTPKSKDVIPKTTYFVTGFAAFGGLLTNSAASFFPSAICSGVRIGTKA